MEIIESNSKTERAGYIQLGDRQEAVLMQQEEQMCVGAERMTSWGSLNSPKIPSGS